MIRSEQLAEALDRIHPRDRELLALSLRRRVPDEALARLYDCEPTEVARRRARAIEELADAMELKRGEDLGAVLKALLEQETWDAVGATLGEEFAVGAGGGRLPPLAPTEAPETSPAGPALTPVPVRAEQDNAAGEPAPAAGPAATSGKPPAAASPPAGKPAPAEPAATGGEPAPAATPPPGKPAKAAYPAARHPAPAASPPAGKPAPTEPAATPSPAANEPVLEMLAAREREVPDPPRRAVPLAVVGLGVASLIGVAGVLGATQFGETDRVVRTPDGDGDDGTRDFVPAESGPLAAPFPTEPRTISCYSTAYVREPTVLYREPGGRRRLRIEPRTEWGSPRVLGVLEQRGSWLEVQAAELRNGETAWLRRDRARVDCVRWSLHADLSKRTLFVRRDGHTIRKMKVAIGRPENPTPEGRFTVTDKLRVTDGGSPYGCCVLALSGHQTDLPEGWPGGDRLAVHATSDKSSIGQPVSLGCMRTHARRARWLIETVPLGAPMFIRA